ncbi:hypothetical protein D3C86_1724230 [compost metagenome]
MVEATVLSKLRCAAASPWTGVSSAWRNWLRVSSTFWVWWVLTEMLNWSSATGVPLTLKLTPAAVATPPATEPVDTG